MKAKLSKIFAVIIAVATVFSTLPSIAVSAADITEISTVEQLKKFADSVNGGNDYSGKTVKLKVNIALGGESNPWTPIGTSSAKFKGTFDGGNHYIEGLYVGSGSSIGLFGYVDGGEIKNVTVRGTVKGSGNVGGVVGYLNAGRVTDCGNEASVSGTSAVGGVVGYVGGTSTISGCYSKGSVTGTVGYIGGVTGQHWRAGTVENCYNSGTVTGPATVGGVVGGHKAASPVLNNCYNSGNIVDSASRANNIGAVVGASRGTNTNCYYIKGKGTDSKSGITEIVTLKSSALGTAFKDGTLYPLLAWESKISTAAPVKPAFVESTETSALLASYIKSAVSSAKTQSNITGTLLGNDGFTSGASSTATDWMALAMGRFGYYESGVYNYMIDDGTGYADYLSAMKTYIETTYSENNGILHTAKATEWHRAVVAVKAIGGDPERFGLYNGKPINLIADGSYNNTLRSGPGTQGLNGWIWGLIALDTGMYDVPTDALYTREAFITEILQMQLTDGVNGNKYGGWVLGGYGSSSDVDMTAMAIQALSPYYNDDTVYTYTNKNSKTEVSKTVRECIDEALDRLGSMMNSNAGFSSWNTDNSESIAQVIVALCSVGIDLASDERFITSDGKTLLDGILRFRVSNGGFSHILNGGWNSMANDQATYALVSYWRFENGMRALYDMRDDWTTAEKTAIKNAINAVNSLPEPSAADYKQSLKAALEVFRAVPESERRYVYNYSELISAVETVGGEDKLDTDAPYIVSVSVTHAPDKTVYFEGEMFDTAGLELTAAYSNGNTVKITDYSLSVSGALKTDIKKVYVIYGNFKTAINITVNEKMPWEGEGTESSPYLIKTADDLKAVAIRVNGGKNFSGEYFEIRSAIDLSDISNWTPIGKTSAYRFEGTFDGKGYAIDNLTSTSGGLFGYVGNNAVIKNVFLASGEITARNSSFIGGIAKWSSGADFFNCFNGADIYCGGYSGGIVGTIRDGGASTVSGCVNVGSIVSSSSSVGGIIGHLDTTRSGYASVSVTVKDCYNTGSVKASDSVGGIIGRAQDGHTFKNCYNAGVIEAVGSSAEEVGGIAGTVTNGNTFDGCYFASDVTDNGIPDSDKAIGKTSEEMKYSEFTVLLGSRFKADKYALLNKGFPLLQWQVAYEADEVDSVTAEIAAIGTVTLESESAIEAARAAYEELSSNAKLSVSNYYLLQEAENRLRILKDEAASSNNGSNGENSGNVSTPDNEVPNTGEASAVDYAVCVIAASALLLLSLAFLKKNKTALN